MSFVSPRIKTLEVIADRIRAHGELQVSPLFVYETLWKRFTQETWPSSTHIDFAEVNVATLDQFIAWLLTKS